MRIRSGHAASATFCKGRKHAFHRFDVPLPMGGEAYSNGAFLAAIPGLDIFPRDAQMRP
jgi:hypothetical protein